MDSGLKCTWVKWLLLLLTVLIYFQALTGEFVWDDRTFFVENDILTNLQPWHLSLIFLKPVSYWGGNLPFSELIFILEYRFFGSYTPAYHTVSLLLYLLIGLQVWKFVSAIYDKYGRQENLAFSQTQQWFATVWITAVFLFHPIHVEAVAYITGQQHLLFVLFSLFSLNLFWRAWTLGELNRPHRLFVPVACYYLAVLAAYQAVAIGILIPALWLVLRKKGEGDFVKTMLGWASLNIPVVIWLKFSTQAYGDIQQTSLPFLYAAARGVRILGAHLILALKPQPLNFGYPFDQSFAFDINLLVGLAILIGLFVSLMVARRSVITIGLLIFSILMFPVLQVFIQTSNAAIYDRYLLLPLLGLCLVAERFMSMIANGSQRRKWIVNVSAVFVLAVLAIMTTNQVPRFSSDVRSLEHAYRTFPGWERAAFDYGVALIEAGQFEAAAELTESEITFDRPVWVRDYLRGLIALHQGEIDAAITYLQTASKPIYHDGYFPFTGVPLAKALIHSGQYDKAERHLQYVLSFPINQPIEKYRAKKVLQELQDLRITEIRK